ncbi:MAG: CvpA family protein [Phycisphaerales bacterium]|nr:CvpA family protein [Phycisphaerales bacterium]
MILSLIAVLLIAGMTFYHSIFGLFSGLINAFCTIMSVCIAYGYFEALHHTLTGSVGMHPAYSLPVAFVGLFVISLLVLRTLADNLLRGNVRVPAAVDWAGGGACGFVNAMCVAGVLATGFMMLPFGSAPGGFERLERTDAKSGGRAQFDRNSLWFSPDAFTAGLFSMLSAGSARGETTFASAYPDLPEWVWWSGNTMQQESSPAVYVDKDGDGVKNGIEALVWWEQRDGVQAQYRSTIATRIEPDPRHDAQIYTPRSGNKLVGVNLTLRRSSADRQKFSAVHNFRPTMIRIVGEDDFGPYHATPVIVTGADRPLRGAPRIVDPDSTFSLSADKDAEIDVYFDVPASFKPRFIEYRRFARVELTGGAMAKAPKPRNLAMRTADEESLFQNLQNQGFLGGATEGSGTGDLERLPFALSPASARGPLSLSADGRVVSGRISGGRGAIGVKQGETPVEHLQRPAGKRIIQVRVKPREAATLAGEVFNFVGQLNQYRLIDSGGGRHELAGYYGIVRRNNDDFIEFYFTPNPADDGFRGMIDFKEIRIPDLIAGRDDAALGLIFVVPPGTTFSHIETQTRKRVEVSLQSNPSAD